MKRTYKITQEHRKLTTIVTRPSRRPVTLPFEREANWRSYEVRIKDIVGRNENPLYQVCVTLAEAKSNLEKVPFLKLIEATRFVGYTKSTINKWVEIGTDKRLKDPHIVHLLPLEIWRLYALHQIQDQAAFEAALHNGLGVREMDALVIK